jgi:hypothetical protein
MTLTSTPSWAANGPWLKKEITIMLEEQVGTNSCPCSCAYPCGSEACSDAAARRGRSRHGCRTTPPHWPHYCGSDPSEAPKTWRCPPGSDETARSRCAGCKWTRRAGAAAAAAVVRGPAVGREPRRLASAARRGASVERSCPVKSLERLAPLNIPPSSKVY